MLQGKRHIHMVGIGGTGMSPLAKILVEGKYQVSGSDLHLSGATRGLEDLGIRVYEGHSAGNVRGADLVVISSAIPAQNPELQEAKAQGIPVVKRAELLGELTRQKRSILVAGTHGKTTTTSMIAMILRDAGLDPTFYVGGEVPNLCTSAKLCTGDLLVAEADEFDGTFLKLSPYIAVVTNVEADHLDFYPDVEAIAEAFAGFIALVPPDGHVVACWDDPRLRELASEYGGRVVGYGLGQAPSETAHEGWRAKNIRRNRSGGNNFAAIRDGEPAGRFSLRIPGRHNVANALAAIAVAGILGLDLSRAGKTLSEFQGALRRFEFKGKAKGIHIYDDYAHHPTEVAATLKAARERHQGRIWAVFQPHTYNRTKYFLAEFAVALKLADRVVVTDVFMPPGREVDTLGVSSRDIVHAMNSATAKYIGELGEAVAYLSQELQPGDMLLTLGAGNVYTVGLDVIERLKEEV